MTSDTNVTLGAETSISKIKALHDDLQTALAAGNPVTINADNVVYIDTACLQLLCSFTKEASEHQLTISWSRPSDYFIEQAKQLGLDTALGL